MSPEALELELDRLHAAAFGWAIACCAGDRAAAEDALQASYLKILDGRARFDGRASFRTKTGLEGRLVRDLRRTAAHDFRRRGVSKSEIMKLCGWRLSTPTAPLGPLSSSAA